MRYLLISALCVLAACNEDKATADGSVADGTADVAVDSVADVAVDSVADVAVDSDTAVDSAVDTDTAVDSAADSDTTVDSAVDTTADSDTTVDTTVDSAVDTTVDSDTTEVACADDSACTMCAFPTAPATADDCYCVFCPSTPMTAAECDRNRLAWNDHCQPWPKPAVCPVASCIPGAPPICEAGRCIEDPRACRFDEDCGLCDLQAAPTRPEDCRCPGCPQPLTTRACDAIYEAVGTFCNDFDFGACPLPPCAFPGDPVCGQDLTCHGALDGGR